MHHVGKRHVVILWFFVICLQNTRNETQQYQSLATTAETSTASSQSCSKLSSAPSACLVTSPAQSLSGTVTPIRPVSVRLSCSSQSMSHMSQTAKAEQPVSTATNLAETRQDIYGNGAVQVIFHFNYVPISVIGQTSIFIKIVLQSLNCSPLWFECSLYDMK